METEQMAATAAATIMNEKQIKDLFKNPVAIATLKESLNDVRNDCNVQEMVKKAFQLGKQSETDDSWIDSSESTEKDRERIIYNRNRRHSNFFKKYNYTLW